jgi:Protein kinase domain
MNFPGIAAFLFWEHSHHCSALSLELGIKLTCEVDCLHYFESQLTHFCLSYISSCRGNFGTVRRATHKETGIKYAAKFLRRRRRATCWIKQIQHEIAVLMLSSDSKQIVKLHAVYETRNEFVLILEM